MKTRFGMSTHPVRLALAASIALLGGCAHSPLSSHWPVPPPAIAQAFSPLEAGIPANARMSAIDAALSGLLVTVGEEATHAAERDWGSGDVVTAGGLMAVLGGMAERIGLVNTGAAIGVVGGAGRARYQYPVQREAYRRAEAALACVQTQVRLFNDDNRVLVLSAGEPAERVGASKAPLLAIEGVDRIRHRLIADLDAVGATPPSRQDIESLAAKVSQAASAPPQTAAAPAASAVAAAKASSTARQAFAVSAEGAASATPQMKVLVERIGSKSVPTAMSMAGEIPAQQAQWLVDDARNIANSYPAELAKCLL